MEVKVEMIRALIPLGLMHANELLQEEVSRLAGEPYQRAYGTGATGAACQLAASG